MHRHFYEGRFHRGRHGWGGRMGHDTDRHERRGRRRFGRFFEHGDLRFVVLALLEEQPRHGYELMKELEDRTGGAYRPSPGVVYPTLALLEDEGLIRQAADPEGGRKLFEITDAGKAEVERNRPMIDGVLQRMEDVSRQAGPGRPRLARAMMNLGMALKNRMARDITPEELDRIVNMIDDTAAAIERS
ncbi:MAG: PadR family transcriptional regulator [Phenylobacterium sp.]|uniref:PadR family transcriptional regulator n=1 Tax=Phenylobacterium sp. TaxID=1871053 RepID=UPI0025E49995|nr:PadR family transcriptional regulator [Phenylobacterium sp.]MBI1197822.1 PadR family transcriptional regulator [Phenylobacterium sp.]